MVYGVPTTSNITVIVMLLFATFDWAKLVRSHSSHPLDGFSVSVERVISVDEQATVLFQVTLASLNEEQA